MIMKKYRVKINNKVFDVVLEEVEEIKGNIKEENKVKKEEKKDNIIEGSVDVVAPIQGNVINILVKVGQKVKKGDLLLLIEAMKLENEVNAHMDGEVVEILVSKGQSVSTNELLVRIK